MEPRSPEKQKQARTTNVGQWSGIPSLPAPPRQNNATTRKESFYLDVSYPEEGTAATSAALLTSKTRDVKMLDEVTMKRVHLSQAESFYCEQTHKMWIAGRREDPDGVSWNQLSPEDRITFGNARQKEVETLIAKGALKKLTVSEAKAFEQKHGIENILDSGFVDKWKTTDDGKIAKSRHVIKGWQDPMILQIERTAPAPAELDEAAVMQVIASEGWGAYVGDV